MSFAAYGVEPPILHIDRQFVAPFAAKRSVFILVVHPDYPFKASKIFSANSSASSGLSLIHCLAASRPCPNFASL